VTDDAAVTVRQFRYEGDKRIRVDAYLAGVDLELSRSQLKRLIDEGDVLVNGDKVKAGYKLHDRDQVEVTLRPAAPATAVPQDIPLTVLFEDQHLIVVDKPSGLVVHPAPGHPDGTLVNALLHHCKDLSGIGGELRPGIVHRLDKDTSGVMVATKDDQTHQGLAELFATKDLLREYTAVVSPPPRFDEGKFDTLYGRHPVKRMKFSSKVEKGKRAVTHYKVATRFRKVAAEVRCRLETGRTHQIRVHFADAGSPVVGDQVYARNKGVLAEQAAALGRQALHAARLEFVHPVTREELAFSTPPPEDMQTLLASIRELASS